MRILGIDPGTAATGFGVIQTGKNGAIRLVAHGQIKTSANSQKGDRLNIIYSELLTLLRQHKPHLVVIERTFMGANTASAMAVGEATGVILLSAARKKLPLFQYTPLQVKLSITGKGRAEKKKVQSEVKKILKLKETPRPAHAADALAVAICHTRVKLRKK